MAAKLAQLKNLTLVLRNYHQLQGGSTVSDFLKLIAPALQLPEAAGVERVNNARNVAEAMLEFYQARIGRELTDCQKAEIISAAARGQQGGLQLSWAIRQRLALRFGASNRKLKRLGGPLLEFPAASAGGDAELTLEQLFSLDMQCRLTGSQLPSGL